MAQQSRSEQDSPVLSALEEGLTRRSFVKRSSLVVMASLTAPSLFAAGARAQQVQGKALKNLVVGTLPEFTTLDPNDLESTSDGIMSAIYDPLVDIPQKQSKLQPWLAESWSWNSNFTRLTLKIRSGVTFHNGKPLTADAVAANLRRSIDPSTGLSEAGSIAGITDVSVSGNNVTLNLSQPNLDLIYRLTWYRVQSPDAFATAKNAPIGTGPFKFVEWTPGDHLTLQRFSQYWKPMSGNVGQVTIKFFSDPEALVSSALEGSIDVLLFGLPKDAARLRSAGWTAYSRGLSDYMVIYLNPTKPALQNTDLRQGIARAVNRAAIAKSVYYGLTEPTTLPVPTFSPAYDKKIAAGWNFNLSAAEKFVKASGLHKPGFTMIIDSSFPDQVQAAQIIKEDLAKIGVTMNINAVDPTTHTNIGLSGDYEALMWYASGGIADPADFEDNSGYRVFTGVIWKKTPPHDYAHDYYGALAATSPAARSRAFKNVWRVLHARAWAIPVAWRAELEGQKKTVTGVAYDINDRLQYQDIAVH